MTTQAFDSVAALKRLLEAGALSEEALQAVTGIQPERLRVFLDEHAGAPIGLTARPQVLSDEEIARLSVIPVLLTEGLAVDDDERLVAIYETLTIEFHLTTLNIGRLIGVEADDVEAVLSDPRSVSIEKRYRLAIAGGYLLNAVNLARRRG